MSSDSQQIVNKAWNFAHVLRDDGLSYMAYTEQITFLLFLKMADEQTKPPYNRPAIVPAKYGWESCSSGKATNWKPITGTSSKNSASSRGCWAKSSKRPGLKSRTQRLCGMIVDLIDVEVDLDGSRCKGRYLRRTVCTSAAETPKGAGQYFTPRELIKAIVDCVQPAADDTICDPAAGPADSCSLPTISS